MVFGYDNPSRVIQRHKGSIQQCLVSFKRNARKELRIGGEEIHREIIKENFPNPKEASRLYRAS